jgi:hypothetical protein
MRALKDPAVRRKILVALIAVKTGFDALEMER